MRKLAADGIDAEEEALLGKLAERVAKTEVELTTYQQREGNLHKGQHPHERQDHGAGHVVGHLR